MGQDSTQPCRYNSDAGDLSCLDENVAHQDLGLIAPVPADASFRGRVNVIETWPRVRPTDHGPLSHGPLAPSRIEKTADLRRPAARHAASAADHSSLRGDQHRKVAPGCRPGGTCACIARPFTWPES